MRSLMVLRFYLPMEGLNSYRHAIAPLLFGADHPVLQQQRVATIQTLGGSGALKVGADFLQTLLPGIRRLGQRSYTGKPRSNIRRGLDSK